jgi:hypothetical protein
MTNSKVPMITDLSEEERKLAQEQTEHLLYMLHECERYVRDYAAGTQNLGKFFGVMYNAETTIADVRYELGKIHGLAKNPPG